MKNISKIQYESDPDADRILRESLAAVIGSSTGGGIYAKDIDIINVTEATISARRRLEEVVTTTDVERRRRLDSSTTKLIIDYSFGVVFEETSFVNETVLVDQVKAAMITRNTTASVTDILVQSAQVFSFVQLENMTVANNFTVYHQHTPWPSSPNTKSN